MAAVQLKLPKDSRPSIQPSHQQQLFTSRYRVEQESCYRSGMQVQHIYAKYGERDILQPNPTLATHYLLRNTLTQ